jgi:hypothetical protein
MTIASDAATPFSSIALQGTGTTSGGGGGGGVGTIQLSATNVGFGTTSSAPQTVTLTNTSTSAAITGLVISVGGTNASDFSDPTTCTSTLAAGASCTITLSFVPKTSTAEFATLTVTASGATNSPQTVSLTGNSVVTLTPNVTGISVTQGGTATYSIAVLPVGGFKGTVNFTCSGPSGSNCSVSPASSNMDGASVANVTLSVYTNGGNGTSAALAPSRLSPRSMFLALLPFSMMGMLLINKRRGMGLVLALVMLCLLMGMVGCGSNSTSGPSGSGLAPNSYQVTFTATSTGSSPVSQTLPLNLVVVNQ